MKDQIKTRNARTFEAADAAWNSKYGGKSLYEVLIDALPAEPFNADGQLQCHTDGDEVYVLSEVQANAVADILELCDGLVYNTGNMAELGYDLPVWYVHVDGQ